MPEPAIDFRAALRLLLAERVRFVVVGGVAMHLQGANNLTLDLDVAYSRDKANLLAMERALASQHSRLRGVPPDLPVVVDARFLMNSQNVTLVTDVGDFDIMGHVAGVDSFEGLWNRSVEMDLGDGLNVHVASLDDLIAMKRAANRPKDQVHVMELEALRRLRQADGAGSADR